MECLAARSAFFGNALGFVALPPFFENRSWLWWAGFIIIALAIYCIVVGYIWYKWGADYTFGPRPPDDDEAQIEALREYETRRWFKENQKKNRKKKG